MNNKQNELHLACGGGGLLLGGGTGEGGFKDGGKPAGLGRIEDLQRIGPMERLKVLAAQK
eukprot:589145-Prymnesium_polylepis.1